MKIDFEKYKRLFTFGCSFTNYYWPTWANIIHQEMPEAELFNLGRAGAGNLYIHSLLMEADARYKFSETDLVMVMFSSYTREDRWVKDKGGWFTPGNIVSNDVYPKDWVKEFADERGYMIRDAALIHSVLNYMKHSPATGHALLSTYFLTANDFRNYNVTETKDIIGVYKDSLSTLPMPLENYETNRFWSRDYSVPDGHPSPIRHYEYLCQLGINLTDASKKYATDAHDLLRKCNTLEDIHDTMNTFPKGNNNIAKAMVF